ncbi:MAG: 4Fe-4S cluster-binding domain-containing protein [Clostridia bacterium]|nr:4Fe-4S cluster-binding domain-containing protein [Clostridia bacterium]
MEEYICSLCPRRCMAERTERENANGYCGMPSSPVAARAALHFGEEPCISGANGSGTVFFSGCSLHCKYCQNEEISHNRYGKGITEQRLADIFRELEQAGAHNINLVNPTHYAVSVRKALELYKPNVPIIYNCGGYERVETLRSLEGLVDVYLPDCKYVDSTLSAALSDAPDYFYYASAAIEEMARQTGAVILNEQGLIQKGTIVRHLVLPGHTKNSIEVLNWLATIKDKVWVSLMFQYTPCGELKDHKELQRPLTKRECEKVWEHMQALGIKDGYVQDRQSAGTTMIPAFNLTGV